MSIAPLLYRLRPILPERFSELVLDSFWERFWEEEAHVLGPELGQMPLAGGAVQDDPELAALPLRGSERAQLIEQVARCYPFSMALELGCAFGQNFYYVARLFPKAEFFGVDLDPLRVDSGNVLLREEGILNATLMAGDIRSVDELRGYRFDVVYSCASLLYLSADEIESAFEAIKSLTPKWIVLLEQSVGLDDPRHTGDPARGFASVQGGGVAPYWHRNYRALLQRIFPRAHVSERKVPAPRWTTEEWRSYAMLTVAKIR